MHLALYRKYRPVVFDDVYGQDHITSVLKYQSANGRVSHAYLFCGSRGTGKTSCAKILAKAANCLSPENGNPCGKCEACLAVDSGAAADVVEMDAASNNGVDNIRDLREEVTYAPAMLRRRVYIIDEVHMLSVSAFNALLKTLEEPPEHVLFILATTELHKLPNTIISRCQRFDFRRISLEKITARLVYVAEAEGISLERGAAERIARLAEGGMRDALSLFELCAAGGEAVTEERVRETLGVTGYGVISGVAEAVLAGDMKFLFETVRQVAETKDISVFWQEMMSFWRDMLVAKYADDFKDYLDLTADEAVTLAAVSEKFNLNTLVWQSGVMDDAMRVMTRSPQTKRVTAELALVRMCRPETDPAPAALAARVGELEDKLKLISAGAAVPTIPAKTADTVTDNGGAAASHRVSETVSDAATADAENKTASTSSEYYPMPDMGGVIEKLMSTAPDIVHHLAASTTEISPDGRRVRVIPANEFERMMLDSPDAKRTVAEAMLLVGVCDTLPDISVDRPMSKKRGASPADDLFGI